ncbi:MAG TPA: neocarzinostatin apoprotein domain-containing protein [Acidimicrobiales bacterium]|nr:neocarzinostatin apoprotein domain-containing protein [Acidimicrobiales bacterium]
MATLLLAAGVVLVGAGPASADGPTVVVTPDHVVEGEQVGMDISGFPVLDAATAVVQCSGAVVATPQQAPSLCGLRTLLALSGPPPAHLEWTPVAAQASVDGSGRIDCRTDPSGCVAGVVAVTLPIGDMSVVASAFDDIVLIDALAVAPARRLADGDVVTVSGRDMEPGDRAVAQCGRAFSSDPTPASAAELCSPPVPVTPDAGGAFTTDLTVHDPLIPAGVGADPVACGGEGCAIVLLPVDQDRPGLRAAGTFGISFGPLRLAASSA